MVDKITEQVERYLADRAEAFSLDELSKRLRISKHRMERIVKELQDKNLIIVRYKFDVMYIMHIGWYKDDTT